MTRIELDRITVERITFAAGENQLEGELVYEAEAASFLGGVVIAGSHPLLGGTLFNNVVQGLGNGLAANGWATVRFNYRGVGGSSGPRIDVARHMAEFWQTSHVEGEMDLWQDVLSAAQFLRSIIGWTRPLILIGYSFGCSLLPAVCEKVSPAALVLVAPPLAKHDYSGFSGLKRPLLAIFSSNDFTSEPTTVQRWFDALPAPKQILNQKLDNHFFRGHETWLVEQVSHFLREYA